MNTVFHVIKYEWKNLWRSSTLNVVMLVVFAAGIYGIFFGKFEIQKQELRTNQVQLYEQQQFDSLLHWVALDTSIVDNQSKYQQAVSPTGVGWNKHFTYYLTQETPASAGLCLGQRDLFPVYYGFNVSDLARQVHMGELTNPMKLLTGNFDLSYVYIFLFPLLIVALFYDLFSGEKEGGTLLLLKSQGVSLAAILGSKALLRALIVWSLAFILLVLGFLIQGVSIVEHGQLFMNWLFVVFLYSATWMGLMGILIWLRQSSTLTAMLGLSVWLMFTLITPSIINLSIQATQPLPNRAEMINKVRNLNDQFWGSPKTQVLDQFYAEYPQYNDGDTTDFYKWYYAGFTIMDREANVLNGQFEDKVEQRNSLLKKWEWLAPAAMVHEHLSKISDTDRESHLEFIKEVHAYHDYLKEFYYQRIFEGAVFTRSDLEELAKTL